MTKPDIAITGYAARLPGANSPAEVWHVLDKGICTVGPWDNTRWSQERFYHPDPRAAGYTYAQRAGLVSDIWGFDNTAFGISAREALQMDPQQRILLEVTAEAVASAGLHGSEWDKARTGVYIGASSSDYAMSFTGDTGAIEEHFMLGNTLSIMSNRISFQFDLTGPSYTVDTACSSSFFALDQAMRALELGEVDTAIVGGVNVLLSPIPFVGFSRATMLSPDGLCKAFDANANGYVRSEGSVVFVLRKLETAKASQDRVRGILVGSGVNSDGRTMGMSLPNGNRQADLMRDVIAKANIEPDDVAFVEAHGTGTAVGDPEEAGAIGAAYGTARSAPLPIGSAKSNFGHLEPVSGLVGLLKAQLALEHGRLPATLHVDELNPNIPFEDHNLSVNTTSLTLPRRARPWVAAVNSFGFGGANSHVILRQPRGSEQVRATAKPPQPSAIMLSAPSEANLQARAGQWAEHLEGLDEISAAQHVNSVNHRADWQAHRLIVQTSDMEAMAEELAAYSSGEAGSAISAGKAMGRGEDLAFAFSGNGSQWDGMGRDQFVNNLTFRASFEATNDRFKALGCADLKQLLFSPTLKDALQMAPVAQPVLFAVQLATVDMLAEIGIKPCAVIGHSVGEVAAATVAGAMSRTDATKLVYLRSLALDTLRNKGTMAAVATDQATLEDLLTGYGGEVSLAGVNSPKSCTISGPTDAIKDFLRFAKSRRIAGRKLDIPYPYHSHLVAPLEQQLRDDLAYLTPQTANIPIYSGTNGARVDGAEMDQDYWWRNARDAVLFSPATQQMLDESTSLVAEISAKPVLRTYLRDVAEMNGLSQGYVATLDDRNPSQRMPEKIAAEAAILGANFDPETLIGTAEPFIGDLPPLLWDHKEYRVPFERDRMDMFFGQPQHPLLGGRMRPGDTVWTSKIDTMRLPWLADHKVLGRVLFPATGYLEICLAVAANVLPDQPVEIDDLDIQRPIVLEGMKRVELRTSYAPQSHRITIEYRPADSSQPFSLAAQAVLWPKVRDLPTLVAQSDGEAIPAETLYAGLNELGYEYGPSFAKLTEITLTPNGAEVSLAHSDLEHGTLRLDPSLADASLHAILAVLEREGALKRGDATRFLPTRIGRCVAQTELEPPARAVIAMRSMRPTSAVVDIAYCAADGRVIARIDGLSLAAVPASLGAEIDTFWAVRSVPVAAPPAHSVAAKLWPNPADVLKDLDLIAEAHPEPDDGALLLDAITHRHAWDMVVGSNNKATPTSKRQRVATGLLVAAEAAEWDMSAGKLTLVDDCPWPQMSELVDALVRTSPARAKDLQAVLRTVFDKPLPGNSAPAPLWQAAQSVLTRIDADLPSSEFGARLLILGQIDAGTTAALHELKAIGAVTFGLGSQDECDAARASLNIAPEIELGVVADIAEGRQFDVIVSVEGLATDLLPKLSDLLEPGGLLIGFEPEPTPYDLLMAQDASKTREPVTALLEPIAQAGFKNVTVEAFADSAVYASVITARGAQMDPVDKSERPLSVAVNGISSFAKALREAFPNSGVIVKPTADTCVQVLEVDGAEPDAKGAMTDLAHGLVATMVPDVKKLWVICPDGLEAAAYSGFLRVLANEQPGTGITFVRIAQDAGDEVNRLAELIATGSVEPELIITADGVAALRVEATEPPAIDAKPAQALALELGARRTLDDLTWNPVERRAPGPGEVEIAVAATGLNFRDVMWAQGLLPPEALEDGFAGATLGMECSGRVLRAGEGSAYLPGDPVIAFSPRSFASHITVADAAVAKMPEGVQLDLAAALPTAFFTAVYSLNEVARIREGESVLVHGGAGGVGLAALQVAKAAGAKVYATAGSAWKRELLLALGVDGVFDSRSLAFADDVMQATDGRGVDIVVNSLAGLAMEQSIKCLAGFGRFIELGKKDYYANTPIGLRDLRRNIAYHGVDVDQLLAGHAGIATRIMNEIARGFSDGDFYVPPVQIFDASDAHSGFRLMQKSGHVGKIVVRAPKVAQSALPFAKPKPIKGAWLVVGGTGGFGLESAKWLAENGAEALWLVSRSGGDVPSGLSSVPVEIRAADVTDEAAMQAVLDEIDTSTHALSGVLHAAMVLDDGLLDEQTPDRLAKVMAPKIAGGRVLDRLTRARKLDHFVLYSSVTTLFGNPGQAAYVAANAWLEALAAERRGLGLAGQAIAWGPISDAGYLSRNDTLGDTLKMQLGGSMLNTQDALTALGDILHAPDSAPCEVVAPVKWGRLARDLALVRSPLFANVDTRGETSGGAETLDIVTLIKSEGPAGAQKRILEVLRAQAGEILRQPKAEVDPTKPLMEMGFDSLLAVSLRMTVEERFGLEIPQVAMTENLTLRDLARQMVTDSGVETGGSSEHDVTIAKHVDGDTAVSREALKALESAARDVKSLTGD